MGNQEWQPYEKHLCNSCVWARESLDRYYKENGFIGCWMLKDIVAMRPFSVEGQPTTRFFTPASALNKYKVALACNDGGIEYGFAYRGVSYCERHETLKSFWEKRMVGKFNNQQGA